MKDMLLQTRNLTTLNVVKTDLEKKNLLEVGELSKKTNNLATHLNLVSDRVKHKKKELTELQNLLEHFRTENSEVMNNRVERQAQLEDKIKELEPQYLQESYVQSRALKIIEICQINQIQNEEWIRKLNFYIANLKKAIGHQENQLDNLSRAEVDRNAEFEQIYSKLKTGATEQSAIVNDVNQIVDHHQAITSQLLNSEKYVNESTREKRMELEQAAEVILRNNQQEAEEEQELTRQAGIQQKLEELKSIERKYSALFKESEDPKEGWEKKAGIKKLLNELEKRKSINSELLEKNFKLEFLQKRKEELERQRKMLEEFSKTSRNIEKNPDYLRSESEYLEAGVSAERLKVTPAFT